MFSNTLHQQPAWRNYACGVYYTFPSQGVLEKSYLPQVELQAHSTILATTSRTTLTQTFVNPSATKGIKEVRYTFPLYDGVSVVGFTCRVGDRTIVGEVKEKEKARSDFQQAVARGETAGLFEQLDTADVFTTTVGNIPPGARIIIKITYLGELKHDMEVDGIRFTIPNLICPRYGRYPRALLSNTAQNAMGSGISITVDAEMAEGSFIQKILSPSHPISVSMGTTSFAPNAQPAMTRASATLSLGTTQLDTDFVLQIVAKDTSVPKAVLETHPTIPNQRALMATLVPKFALPQQKPEIVFVVDRSGSMGGMPIKLVRQALLVFLKSLPVGVTFNICSFGSRYSFLWPKSVAYSQDTLDEAVRHVESFDADYGGTEILAPLKTSIEQRYRDIPLEIMLLTDGAIWDQDSLFSYLNKEVSGTKAPIRVYSLGIGSGVSHSLIEGIARAGNGFAQTVGEGEKMDSKVVRMLKGALSPHVNDYTLEVKYADKAATEEHDDDFEVIEKVTDSLRVKLALQEKEKPKPVGFQSKAMQDFFTNYYQKKPISLFDTSADPDKEEPPACDETGQSRYAHLPTIRAPKIIQAPQNIPPLFAFNRTTVYLLLGPDAPQKTPRSVILRGTSTYGPLELEIPIQILDTPGEMIHQLAAKKAISELEQGRGWLPEAKDESERPLKELYESRFQSMVEREAVRLGVQFQVSGKWCSFIAVEKRRKHDSAEKEKEDWEWLEDEEVGQLTPLSNSTTSKSDDLSTKMASLNQLAEQLGKEVNQQSRMINRMVNKTAGATSAASFPRPPLTRIGSENTPASNPFLVGGNMLQSASITNPMERGERLDSLAASSSGLFEQSKMFYTQAKKSSSGGLFGGLLGNSLRSASNPASHAPPSSGSLFGSSSTAAPASAAPPPNVGRGLFENLQPGGDVNLCSNSDDALESFDFDSFLHGGSAPTGFNAPNPQQQQQQQMPAGGSPPPSGTHALQDYQMQTMLLQQQNKKRLLLARQEQEGGATANALPPPPPQASFGPLVPQPAGLGYQATSFGAPTSPAAATQASPFAPLSSGTQAQYQAPSSSALFGFSGSTAYGSAQQSASAPRLFGSSGAVTFGSAKPSAPGSNPFSSYLFGSPPSPSAGSLQGLPATPNSPFNTSVAPKTDNEILTLLISLQTFEGYWEWKSGLFTAMKVSEAGAEEEARNFGVEKRVWATALAIAYFEERLDALKGSWELVVQKARDWLGRVVAGGESRVEELVQKGRAIV